MIIGILAVAILPLFYYGITTSKSFIIQNSYDLSTNLSETISNVAREELFINKTFEGSERVVRGLNKNTIKGLKQILVVNVSGQIVVDSEENLLGEKLSDSEINYLKQIDTLDYRDLTGDSEILRFTYPIFLEENRKKFKIGAAIFDFKKEELFQSVVEVRNSIIQYSLLSVSISLLVTFFMSGRFLRPLEDLKTGAIIIGSGNLHYRIKIKTKDEIGQLGNDFNRMAEALQKSDKMKDDFLANTTHELKTPLNGIIGLAESMLENPEDKLSDENTINSRFIVSSGRRLLDLINNILDFSKLKNQDVSLHLSSIDLHQIVDLILLASKPQLKNKHVKLTNEIPPNFPSVSADENRLQQILYNLVGNAIKFTESGFVKVSAVQKEEKIEISVEDSGIGIPSDKLDLVFHSFQQVDSSISRIYGGTGLGLSITKNLVELHGSKIGVESELGRGSRFYFTLDPGKAIEESTNDLSLTKINEIEEGNDKQLSKEDPEEFQKITDLSSENFGSVLVVDDEQVNLHVLRNQLKTQKYDTTIAINGLEALDLLNQGVKPDLVLLDIMMPKMNGYEVCRQIRKKFSIAELPILMITAKNQISDLLEGMESGANDYITKPFTQKELLARVKTHLNVSKLNHSYEKFVPKEFLEYLNKDSIIDLKLGDQVEIHMSVLFSDIRSFTSISEKLTAEETFQFVNSFLDSMVPQIIKHSGFIDKYIGDAIMALFKEPQSSLEGAIDMLEELYHFNQRRKEKNLNPISIGIGIHTGKLILGIVGSEKRIQGTVLSDAVNLASRLESLTKLYGATLLISEETLKSIPDVSGYSYRMIDRVKVKGKERGVNVIEILNGNSRRIIDLKLSTREEMSRGLESFRNSEFQSAIESFERIIQKDPKDKAAAVHLERSRYLLKHGVPPDWEGIIALNEK